jgi:hydrogenase expression/formation protein HypC
MKIGSNKSINSALILVFAMCLAVPMKIKTVDGYTARCEAKGVERDVSLFMLQSDEVAIGDYVLVHVGYAIQKVSAAEAAEAWQLFDQILETIDA